MTYIFKANDGTTFDNPYDCFNYEWREDYPNMRVYDGSTGNRISDVTECTGEIYIFRFYNIAQRNCILKFLTEIEGYIEDDAAPIESGYISTTDDSYILVDTIETGKKYFLEFVPLSSDLIQEYGQ